MLLPESTVRVSKQSLLFSLLAVRGGQQTEIRRLQIFSGASSHHAATYVLSRGTRLS